jgi:hypothetical protein
MNTTTNNLETREERNYGAEPWRAPDLAEGDTLLYSECGRIIKAHTYGHGSNGVDYRSHYFRVVKNGSYCYLLVKHGAGRERIQIDYSAQRAAQFFDHLDTNESYLLMHMLFSLYKQTRRDAEAATAATYKSAFISGKLKKRKARGQDSVKVWIDNGSMLPEGF